MYTSKITANLVGNTTAYLNVFDRRWWREDDVFVRASALETGDFTPVPYFQSGDLVRVGGDASNFGILRTFYVGGIAQDYSLTHSLGGHLAKAEAGVRAHWERFIDDKKIGDAPDARDGVYYTGTPGDPDDPVKIVGQSHHYETAALALYAKEQIEWGRLTLDPGLRFEVFKQDRVDRLRGSILADKVSAVLLPGLGVNYQFGRFNAFAGVHPGLYAAFERHAESNQLRTGRRCRWAGSQGGEKLEYGSRGALLGAEADLRSVCLSAQDRGSRCRRARDRV